MRRALPFLAVLALAGCGSHPKPPATPTLSALLAHRHSVHFVLDGTVKLDLQSVLSMLHHVPPLRLHAVGDASQRGLKARGDVRGDVSAAGSVVVAGDRAFAGLRGTWYDLGSVKLATRLLRGAHWTVAHGASGRPSGLNGSLHLTTKQLEQLSGLSLPFGIDGADATVHMRLSRWGEPVTITAPSGAIPVPHG